jgi:hypothetical protein
MLASIKLILGLALALLSVLIMMGERSGEDSNFNKVMRQQVSCFDDEFT